MMACVKEGRNRYKVSSHNSGMKCDNLITYSYIILSNHFYSISESSSMPCSTSARTR